MEYTTVVQGARVNATGLEVPADVLAALGGGRRPAVTVTVQGYTYRTTVGVVDGRAMIPVSAEHRAAAGVAAGDEVVVEVVLDTEPRTVDVPEDLAAALEAAGVRPAFDALSPSRRKAHAVSVTGAKAPETRARRVAAAVDSLR